MATTRGRVRVSPRSLALFLRACDRAELDASKMVPVTLKRVGDLVARDARTRMLPKHRPSAAYATRVRSRSVAIAQTKLKTSGKHPEWGSWQMKHDLIPVLAADTKAIDQEFVKGTEQVAKRFEKG